MRKFRWMMVLMWMFLASCTVQTPGATPTTLGVSVSPLGPFQSPVQAVPTSAPWTVPTPAPGKAVVSGQIVDRQTQLPPPETTMFLGSVDSLNTGQPIVSMDPGKSPFAGLTLDGHFVFAEVVPGEYGLVLHTPDLSFLIDNPKDGKSMILKLEAGQSLDLGKIELTMPE